MTASEGCAIAGCPNKAAPDHLWHARYSDGSLGPAFHLCRKHHTDLEARCGPRQPGSYWTYHYTETTTAGGYTVTYPTLNL